jgi:hypothetical protein
MIKLIALVALLGCFFASSITAIAATSGKPATAQVAPFIIGEKFQIESKVLKCDDKEENDKRENPKSQFLNSRPLCRCTPAGLSRSLTRD